MRISVVPSSLFIHSNLFTSLLEYYFNFQVTKNYAASPPPPEMLWAGEVLPDFLIFVIRWLFCVLLRFQNDYNLVKIIFRIKYKPRRPRSGLIYFTKSPNLFFKPARKKSPDPDFLWIRVARTRASSLYIKKLSVDKFTGYVSGTCRAASALGLFLLEGV